jgi:hypothetical protein
MDRRETKTVLDGSAFARGLRRLLDTHLARAVDEETVMEFGEWCGYDLEAFRARLLGDLDANFGDPELSRLSFELELSGYERRLLTDAYLWERDATRSGPDIEEDLEHLTERLDYTPEEAERMMRDADLWQHVLPEYRLEGSDEEAAKDLRKAYHAVTDLVLAAEHVNKAAGIALMEAQALVAIALERAQARVREGSTE